MNRDSRSINSSRDSILLRLLRAPWRILGLILLVVFAVEAFVMLLLPLLLPQEIDDTWEAIFDAALLTIVCAPLLWWIIIGPLRRVAIEAQALSSTIVENAGDGIIAVDRNGVVLSYNPAARTLFGFEPDAILGRPAAELFPEISLTSTAVGETVSTSGLRRDGARFPAAVSVRGIGDEEQSAFVAVVRDLTEARKAEEQRTETVREQEALRAQQMATLAQLATGVAHEIRNPLTAIKMLVQTTQPDGASTSLEGEDLKIVEDQIRRMERSVNTLLDFARPTPAERRRINLPDLLPDVVRLLEGQAAKQSVELLVIDGTAEMTLDADPTQLQQLLLNLGLNALSVMPDGGTLTFTMTNHADGKVCLQIMDTGPGIDDELLDQIFLPFVTTRKQGIGLGLSICKRIADEHGGTLTVRNHHAGGAVFELCLPIRRNEETAVKTESES